MLPLGEGIVFELELLCEPRAGCGITITGSRSSGIAVKYLHPGGPASQVSSREISPCYQRP